jgi:hypothetical protein
MDEADVTKPNSLFSRKGRRMTDDDNTLTFPVAISKIAIWGLASMLAVTGALLTWLCLSQLALSRQIGDMNAQLLVMSERANNQLEQMKTFNTEMQALRLADASIKMRVEEIQIQQAEHGWKRGN